MINKITKLMSIVIITMCLTSCTSKAVDQINKGVGTINTDNNIVKEDNKNVDIQKTQDTDENDVDKHTKISDERESEYEVVDDIYTEKGDSRNISIKFPQVTGLVDKDKQKKINALLKASAAQVINSYDDVSKEENLDIDIKYYISLNNKNIVSIQYIGLAVLEDAPHPHKLFYTVNIDMNNGKTLRLVDFIKDNEELVKILYNAEYKPIASPDEIYLLSEHLFSYEEAKKDFINADNIEDSNGVFTFFTNESLVIVIPANHAVGGSAEFHIKYHNLIKYLNDDSDRLIDLIKEFK